MGIVFVYARVLFRSTSLQWHLNLKGEHTFGITRPCTIVLKAYGRLYGERVRTRWGGGLGIDFYIK